MLYSHFFPIVMLIYRPYYIDIVDLHDDYSPTPQGNSDGPDIHTDILPTKVLIYLSSRDVVLHA